MPPFAARGTQGSAVLLACAALLLAAGCATTAPALDVPPDSRVVVSLEEPARGLRLALANASHPELRDVYSSERADGSLKLAPDRLVGELLWSLEHAGLRAHGREVPQVPPRDGRPRLVVEQDGLVTLFVRPEPGVDPEGARAFGRLELVMNEYYRHVGGLQAVENEQGGALFRRQPGAEIRR